MTRRSGPPFGAVVYVLATLALGSYFAFAAVQGDYGVFRRAEIESQARILQAELSELQAEVARMENLTRRLSEDFLDLDLLDQQARDVLGLIRTDEVVLR